MFPNFDKPFFQMTIFIKNSFFEVEFTYHKTRPLKVYNSIIFNKFIELWNHHNNPVLECFYHPPSNSFEPIQTTNFAWARGAAHSRFAETKLLLGNFESQTKCACITGFGGPHFRQDFFFLPLISTGLPAILDTYSSLSIFSIHLRYYSEKWNKPFIQIWLIWKMSQGVIITQINLTRWQIILLAVYGKEKKPKRINKNRVKFIKLLTSEKNPLYFDDGLSVCEEPESLELSKYVLLSWCNFSGRWPAQASSFSL